jgi:hypothetical protein
MKVKELIEKLQEFPEDLPILLPFVEEWDVKKTKLKWIKSKGYYIHPDSYKHLQEMDDDSSNDKEIIVLF